jgi:hypothetical protein
VLGWVQPPVQEVMDWVGKQQQSVSGVLDVYIAGAEEPLLLSAVSEEPGMGAGEESVMIKERPLAIAEETVAPALEVVEVLPQVIQDRGEEAAISLGSPKSRKRGKVTA